MRRNECLNCRFRNKTWHEEPCSYSSQSPFWPGAEVFTTFPCVSKEPPTFWQKILWWLTDKPWRNAVRDERVLGQHEMEG